MTNKKLNYPAIAKEMAILTVAVAIIAAAVYFFLVPSHTSVSSISGLGIVLSNFVPLPLSAITMVLNIVLLIIGFFTCGREFGAKTVYTSVMLPVFLGLFERLFPDFGSMTDSQELDVLCYILVVSVGLSILFNRNASSGGLDIVAKIMNKYLHMELGKAMSLSGMCVALSAALVYDKKTVVLSILGTYFNGIVLSNFVPLPLSVITMILNVVLLIIGFFTCGREFGAKTVYTSVLLPVFLGLFEKLFPEFGSMTGSQELDVLCYILVVSIGLSILFNRNASSGGLDIVAKIMNKYLHMELGKAMSLSGMCVALSAALVYDKKTVVLSILGTYFNGIVLDHFIFDNSIKRRVCIITEKEEALRQFILHDLHSGATMYEAIGAYNLEKHNEIITIVDKSEYQKLMNFINREDPKAFVTIYNVSSMQYQPKI